MSSDTPELIEQVADELAEAGAEVLGALAMLHACGNDTGDRRRHHHAKALDEWRTALAKHAKLKGE